MCIYHSICGDVVLKFNCEGGADNVHHQQLNNIGVCMYIYMSACLHACMYVCMYVCNYVCICMYVYMDICVYV